MNTSVITSSTFASEDNEEGPWHQGEIRMQELAGVREEMVDVGKRVFLNHLIEQHRQFYPQLPFAVFGTVDENDDVWATLRANHPGFLISEDPNHLIVKLPRDSSDPANSGMEDGQAIGMIGIELHTRRRNRLNGKIIRQSDDQFAIRVGHSFGNCPQYIRRRNFKFVGDPFTVPSLHPETSTELTTRARDMIAKADTFFVATFVDRDGKTREIDVSHRGGKPGFVRLDSQGTLTIPDFAGNLFFNTLGNILSNPKAGLVFADFANGDLLQLTGDAEVITEGPEIDAFLGAERLWRVFPRKMVWRESALPIRWHTTENSISPNSLLTGDWESAEKRLSAGKAGNAWRCFRIAQISQENHLIRSFHLEPADQDGTLSFQPGQHLPIRVNPQGHDKPLLRTYTLSSSPSDEKYRISVKREGAVSSHLHDKLNIGDTIETGAPSGDFFLKIAIERPVVLMAGGIGITPMISMIRHAVYEGLRTRHFRAIWLFYAARNISDRAFDDEISELVNAAQGNIRLIRVLHDTNGATPRKDYDASGFIDMNLLRSVLPFDDFDFYLCGPPPFMQGIYDGLRGLNIADNRIHAEAFGPASLTRTPYRDDGLPDLPVASTKPVSVEFTQSRTSAVWQPDANKTLLELAEDAGLAPEASCRGGSCGTCRTKVTQGSVTYKNRPSANVGVDEALICCAVPAEPEDGRHTPLVLSI
ncbi:pyridoxamine 5'-phosphate oxidase family protein [uncultured Thalassospira sp.]|mgnify:CR=1 FL=1|uniref:pyridoxamine 5'-phosphate oxidase family protein n=1 Tax=uncultured Thalassospira sp. TaxID=404382 RepID=UPI00258C746A|nr:pyridoxamine 5'-phosphate oxidase family protein [uncultured Thalassospira sp.]